MAWRAADVSHALGEVIGIGEVHAILEDCRHAQQKSPLLLRKLLLVGLVVEEIDNFTDPEDISLADAGHYGDLVPQHHYPLTP